MPWSNQAVSLIVIEETVTGFSGIFGYSPTIGPGNLVFSITARAGTDPFNNPYDAGINVYGGPAYAGAAQQAIQLFLSGGVPIINLATGALTEAAPSQIKAGIVSPGGAGEQEVLVVAGPTNTVSDDAAFIQLSSSPHNAAGEATGFLEYQEAAGGDTPLLAWGGLGLSRYSLAGLNGGIPLSRMDFFTRTANTTAVTALTTGYPLPANDASTPGGQQTTYHLRAGGSGTEANPAVNGTFAIEMYGTNVYVSVTTPFAQAGHSFSWVIDVDCMISGNGAAANFAVLGHFQFSDLTAGTQVSEAIIGGATVNNTVPGTMVLNWQWSSVAGGPTISCPASIFTRKGV